MNNQPKGFIPVCIPLMRRRTKFISRLDIKRKGHIKGFYELYSVVKNEFTISLCFTEDYNDLSIIKDIISYIGDAKLTFFIDKTNLDNIKTLIDGGFFITGNYWNYKVISNRETVNKVPPKDPKENTKINKWIERNGSFYKEGLRYCLVRMGNKELSPIILEALFETIQESMINGYNIYIRGFGSFVNKKRATKIARNISKNEPIEIQEHYIPVFKPCRQFKELIKNSNIPTKKYPHFNNRTLDINRVDRQKLKAFQRIMNKYKD
jgi:DNA-binding protein HU-beta